MNDLSASRREYQRDSLDESNVNPDPLTQFAAWFADAEKAGIPDANAMHLASVSKDGRPSGRIVLLKGIEGGRFIFFTNYQSRKGHDLDVNPACALTFYWSQLERQVRIEGPASRVDEPYAENYFQSRPRDSQIGAWASPQSSMIAGRAILEERFRRIETKYKGQDKLPKPKQWGGYAVTPLLIEFWQGRPSRLHDRIQFTWTGSSWDIRRLAP
jgi:pyridoxamine 5'-phosphate oxidase